MKFYLQTFTYLVFFSFSFFYIYIISKILKKIKYFFSFLYELRRLASSKCQFRYLSITKIQLTLSTILQQLVLLTLRAPYRPFPAEMGQPRSSVNGSEGTNLALLFLDVKYDFIGGFKGWAKTPLKSSQFTNHFSFLSFSFLYILQQKFFKKSKNLLTFQEYYHYI